MADGRLSEMTEAEVDELQHILEFYADPKNHDLGWDDESNQMRPSLVTIDNGSQAQAGLALIKAVRGLTGRG